MEQFKKMKMRINNPEHSKAVQEWLFEQGYSWGDGKRIKYTDSNYLFTNAHNNMGITHTNDEEEFKNIAYEEINVQHLDPHLYSVHKSEKPKMKSHVIKSEFEKLSEQLKHLDKAIDSHENKQNKRKLDRERIVEKMNGMLPKGYVMVKGEGTENHSTFYPNEIVVGSVWEYVKPLTNPSVEWRDFTEGYPYEILEGEFGEWLVIDDVGDEVELCTERLAIFIKHFKRIF